MDTDILRKKVEQAKKMSKLRQQVTQNKKNGCLDRFLLLMIAVALSCFFVWFELGPPLFSKKNNSQERIKQKVKTPKESREERINKGFSVWDGAHKDIEKIIKASLNDPDSYKHIKTQYWDMKDHLIVTTTFSGKNAFGGVVRNWIKAKCDLDGNVIEVLEQGH